MSVAVREFVAKVWPVAMLIVAMCSIQTGASIAKTLFPIIGATGTTSIRLILAAGLLLIVMRPWRQRTRAVLAPSAYRPSCKVLAKLKPLRTLV